MKVRIEHTDASFGMTLRDVNNSRISFVMGWNELEDAISSGRIKKTGRFIRGRTFIIHNAELSATGLQQLKAEISADLENAVYCITPPMSLITYCRDHINRARRKLSAI